MQKANKPCSASKLGGREIYDDEAGLQLQRQYLFEI